MFFSTKDGSFTSTFSLDTSITEPTRLYLNKDDWYPEGYISSAVNADGKVMSNV